jgi:hypothetical protein
MGAAQLEQADRDEHRQRPVGRLDSQVESLLLPAHYDRLTVVTPPENAQLRGQVPMAAPVTASSVIVDH